MQWAAGFCRGYFQMCAAAALVILIFLVLRLILRRFPKNILCVLWMAVFFRLLCPVAVQGPIPDLWGWNAAQRETAADTGGLMAGGQAGVGKNDAGMELWQEKGGAEKAEGMWAADMQDHAQGTAGLQGADGQAPDADGKGHDAGGADPANPAGDLWMSVSAAWQAAGERFAGLQAAQRAALACGFAALLGTVIFMILGIRRYAALARLTRAAVKVETAETVETEKAVETAGVRRRIGGRQISVLECAGIPVPMVFGMLCPAIYLPAGFTESVDPRERELILRHEEAHIRRGDHLLKILSWAVLGLHWWNPLVWICVALFQKDMEMACDESVMAHTTADMRAEYAGALLHFSMRRSGLMSPAAFGESNTQKRVRNILRYHKRPVALTTLTLCTAGVLAVCLATNPHTVKADPGAADGSAAGAGRETDPADADGRDLADFAGVEGGKLTDPADSPADLPKAAEKTTFASVEEMGEYYLARWQKKLSGESAPSGADAEGGEKVWYVGAEETEFFEKNFGGDGRQQNAAEDVQYIEMTFCTMERNTGIPTVYKTWAACTERDGGLSVEDVEEESFARVDTAEQARRMGSFPFWGYFGQDRETGANCAGVITERGMSSSGMWQFDLEEPESAAVMLLHLEGGSAKFRMHPGEGEESGYVMYTFADGSTVTYQMSRRVARSRGAYLKEYWFPEGLMDEVIAREQVERAAQAQRCIESVTVQKLQKAMPFEQYVGEFDELQDGYVLLDQVEGRDLALYGLLGGDAMVLRDGERCYPVYRYWTSPQMHLPRIYAGDYDGDGEEEYALWTHMGTGTGVSSSELYIIEKTADGLSIREFDCDALKRQFAGVGYDWDPGQQTLYIKVDGERTGLSLSLRQLLEEGDGERLHFQGLEFHDISDFVERDGQWYYWTRSGIALEEWAILSYEYGVEAEAPVVYQDGGFSLGEITLKEYKAGE